MRNLVSFARPAGGVGSIDNFTRIIACIALLAAIAPSVARAALDVDPPQPITRRVTVQLIQTALTDGSVLATAFGNTTQRADIEAGLDAVWAQAGIDINVLPTINRYNNTFAYQGTAGTGTRDSGDLDKILSAAASAGGILSSDSLTLNLFLVNVVPGFEPLQEGYSAGLARVNNNGIAGFVGDNLLGFPNGIAAIASVMAHEIGHNLGLNHTASGQPNLMSPSGTTEQLDSLQIATARSSRFARVFTPQLTGDYNNNGVVDAGDYAAWRKSQGSARVLPNDPIGGTVGAQQYTQWRSQFGKTGGSGAGLTDSILSSSVPEPTAFTLIAFAVLAIYSARYRRS